MPVVVAGAAVSAIAAGVAEGFTTAVVGAAFFSSLILGGLSYALTPKPKKVTPFNNTPQGTTVAVNQPDLSRLQVYGHTLVTRGYARMEAPGDNGKLHSILMLCEGPLRAINEIWVNDYCIPPDWIDADGNVTQGRYAGKLVIRKHLGATDQAADMLAVSNIDGWSAQHRLCGIAYLYIIATRDQDVFPTGNPNYAAIVEGPARYDPRAAAAAWNTNIALYARDYLSNSDYGYGALDSDFDDDNIAAQANICDEIVAVSGTDYTITHADTATGLITLDCDILPLCFGDRIMIASSGGSVPGGLSADTDYYVIPYQVRGNDDQKPRILLAASLADAMEKTALALSDAGSGTLHITQTGEPRYHGSGTIDTETALAENMNNIVNSMAGRAVNTGGYWTLLAGAWRTPEVSYDIGDLRDALNVKCSIEMAEMFNVTKGLFVGPASFYQATDYPANRYQTFIDDDGGIEAPKEMNLPFTDRPTAAQRIAKIELFRGRQQIAVATTLSARALQNQPGDNVGLSVERYGWDDKYFEITQFATQIANNTINHPVALRETAQTIFDWSAGEAIDYDPAPNSNLPDPFRVAAVQGLAFNSRYIETQGSDAVYILYLTWEPHPDALVQQYGDFEVQFKKSSESDWRPSFFVDGGLSQTDVVTVTVNVAYDMRIRARNSLGVRSGWNTITGALAGTSGGVGTTNDWGAVADTPGSFLDFGVVTDTIGTTDDWGYVT